MRVRWHLRMTEAQWNALSRREQIDWLAWDLRRQRQIEHLNQVTVKAKYPDPASYMMTLLALID